MDFTLEEIEKSLNQMSSKQLDRFADNLKKIVLFLANRELRKAVARRIADADQRITRLERKYRVGPYKTSVRKSIQGQDDDGEATLWPSMTKLL